MLLAHEYVVLSPCFLNLSSKGECKVIMAQSLNGHNNEGNSQAEKYQNFSSRAVIYCEFCYRVLQGWLVFVSMDLVPSTKS